MPPDASGSAAVVLLIKSYGSFTRDITYTGLWRCDSGQPTGKTSLELWQSTWRWMPRRSSLSLEDEQPRPSQDLDEGHRTRERKRAESGVCAWILKFISIKPFIDFLCRSLKINQSRLVFKISNLREVPKVKWCNTYLFINRTGKLGNSKLNMPKIAKWQKLMAMEFVLMFHIASS